MKNPSETPRSAKAAPSLSVKVSRRIRTSPESAYDAFLELAKLRRFLYATRTGKVVRAELDPRVGGKFVITDRCGEIDAEHNGTFLELMRPRRIVYSFFVPGYSKSPDRVTVDIAATAEGCEVSVTHEMLPEYAPYVQATVDAYTEHLERLEEVLQGIERR